MKDPINPLQTSEAKHQIARDFGISESQIDESVIGLFLCFKSVQDKSSMEFIKLNDELSKVNKKINSLNAPKTVEYSNPKTAFWGEFGGLGISVASLSILLSVITYSVLTWNTNQTMIKNYKALNEIIEIKEDGFFVNKRDVKVSKNGYTILSNSK